MGEPPTILLPLKHNFQEMPGDDPTCDESGCSSYKECTRCGEIVGKRDLPAYNHSKTTIIKEIPATCTLEGQIAKEQCAYCLKYKCINCGNWIASTTCENCGADPNKIINELGHAFIQVPARAAVANSTGSATGWNSHQVCSRPGCGATEGKVIWTSTPKQHYGNNCNFTKRDRDLDRAATCEKPGRKNTYKCWHWDCHNCPNIKYTEVPALGHDFTDRVGEKAYLRTKASCTTPASYYYKCKNCNKSSENYTKTYWIDYANTPNVEHDWKEIESIEATCKESGRRKLKCNNCEYTTEYNIAPNLENHPKENGIVKNINTDTSDILEASCTTTGYKFIHCSECDCRIRTDHLVNIEGVKDIDGYWAMPIPATGHEYDEAKLASLAIKQNISCRDLEAEQGGKPIQMACEKCKKPFEQVFSNITHNFGEWTLNVQDSTDSTSETIKKVYGHRRICATCGTIEYGNCTFNKDKAETIVNPTCVSNGYKTYRCTICNLVSKVYSEKDEATGHTWSKDFEITTETHTKTCKTCGVKETAAHTGKKNEDGTTRCTSCNFLCDCTHENKQLIEAELATCNKTGLTAGYKCAALDCGAIITPQKTIEKLTHNFIAIKELKAPTCEEDGNELIECTLCQSQQERKINKLGHMLIVLPEITPSCNAIGWTAGKKCVRCEKIIESQQIIPAFGKHVWDSKELDASCEKCFIKTCSRCNVQEREISQLCPDHITTEICEHVLTEPYLRTEPTCTVDGWTDGIRCKICKAFIKAPETLTKLGHNIVFVAEKSSECETDGHAAGYKCTRCGLIQSGLKTIEAPGHNTKYVDYTENSCVLKCMTCDKILSSASHTFENTSETQHKCTKCGRETSHNTYTVSTSSCTSRRTREYCKDCSYSAIISSSSGTGHSYSPATCTSASKCTKCGQTKGTALGHSYSTATCKKPATCTRCGATSGSAKSCQTYYFRKTRDATCTSAAYGSFPCVWCGRTIKSGYQGNPLGHNYVNGKCTRCGRSR